MDLLAGGLFIPLPRRSNFEIRQVMNWRQEY
jgi:hypothetical protein